MAGRISDRRVDKDPGWIERRFRELEAKVSGKIGPLTPVSGGSLTIQQFITNPASIIKFWNTDTATAIEGGDLTFTLTHTPLEGSLHVYWGPLFVPVANWLLDEKTLTVYDSDLVFGEGDLISTAYAYDGTLPIPVTPAPGSTTLVAYESTGWKWSGSLARTDPTDYSSPAFDDSGWSVAQAAFGTTAPVPAGWPSPHTLWVAKKRMWARRTLAATAGASIIINARIEYEVEFYLNGTLVGAAAPHATEMAPITVPGASVLSSNSLAVKITDNNVTGGASYFDMEVTQ